MAKRQRDLFGIGDRVLYCDDPMDRLNGETVAGVIVDIQHHIAIIQPDDVCAGKPIITTRALRDLRKEPVDGPST
jgi:hypothetical protein